ncbi:hypothetical protein X943_002345 [Babesia divergens]|uniref:CCR4-NOT transcription complex subunit 1 n=1 Tax=Babesia divergens TaxID=32595 RepID=A0AAD9GJN6_BABDI|nr:hypothetical protein X943_002345 [Babesia divergens]
MTLGGEAANADQSGQQRSNGAVSASAHAKERLRAMCPAARQPVLQRLLDEAPWKVCSKEFVQRLDLIYAELTQTATAAAQATAPQAEIAEHLLSALTPLSADIYVIATLIHTAVYTEHAALRKYTERRLFHCVFELHADVKGLEKVGCARLLLMILLHTENLFVNSDLPDCDKRLKAATAIATELLLCDEENVGSGRKEKNDVVNTIANFKMENRSMKKLLNKSHWDSLCSDLRFYPSQPQSKHLAKVVHNLRRICEFVAFNTDVETQVDYINILTSGFLKTTFQVDLLLQVVDLNASLHDMASSYTKREENFEKIVPQSQKGDIASVMWLFETDVICLLLALLNNEHQIFQFKALMQEVLKGGRQQPNHNVAAKALIYALTNIWIRDQAPIGHEKGIVKARLATKSPLFWFLYDLCLQHFVSSDILVTEIRQLGGESLHRKNSSHLFEFMGAMAKSLSGEYLILIMLEVMRYVKYNSYVISYMLNLFQGVLLDIFKCTAVNFSKGILEIVCYCRQTFDWGFMNMLIYSVDAILNGITTRTEEGASRNDMAKSMLAGGFMDYLRWKLHQIREIKKESDDLEKIYVPSSNIVAEIFCILNHTIGTCDELLDLFQTYNAQYKALNYYNVLLLPLYKALEIRGNANSYMMNAMAKALNEQTPSSSAIDMRERVTEENEEDCDIYSYLVLNENIETTTSQIVDVIMACKFHTSILNALSVLNNEVESLRSQTIIDVILHKYINRLIVILNLSVPKEFCLHSLAPFDDDVAGVAPRLTMLARFTGKLLGMHLLSVHCDSVYMLFRIVLEALQVNKIFLVEFAMETFSALGNVIAFPVFTRMFTADERFCKLYPQFAAKIKTTIDSMDPCIFEIYKNALGSLSFGETQCLRNLIDTKARSTTGLTILKQQAPALHEFDTDHDSGNVAPKSASMVFSIVNLAANVQYKPLLIEPLWYQEQIAIHMSNVALDDLLGALKIDFPAPPNALEIMSIMEMSISNKTFITHVEQLVTQGYADWLLLVIYRYILIRGYTYFRDCIVFMAALGGTRMMDAMVKFTAYCLNMFLKCLRSCRGNSLYRKLLSVSCGWLGEITLGRNKPLLTKHLDLKYLILYAYQNGLLTVIIPAACKLLISVKNSKIFKLPNPWTSSLLNLLADISMSSGLKSTLQFDLSMLFRNLEYVPGPRSLHNIVKEMPVSDLDRSPKLGNSIWSNNAITHMSTGMHPKNTEFQAPPITQDLRSLLKRKIMLNPKVACLNAKWPWVDMILNAIESCYLESSQLIEKTMVSCVTATRHIVMSDFAPRKYDMVEVNEELLKMSATAMATGLATSLIMATAREQLCSLMTMRLHMQILSLLSMDSALNDSALSNNLEQVSGFLSKDNLGLLCALVEHAALELITGCISESIGDWIAVQRNEPIQGGLQDVPTELSHNIHVDIYKRFGALVPFALARIQKDKQITSPLQGPFAGAVPGVGNVAGGMMAGDAPGMGNFMNSAKQRGSATGFRLPSFMIIPPIDNLPTSLISCKVEEFQHRVKEAAKTILTHPPAIPLINSKYIYTADSSTLLLLSCLPRNHALFTLLWSMHYMFKHAANQPECVESLINKVLRTTQETPKGLDMGFIVQEVELSLLEMVSVDCPLVIDILTNLVPKLGPARICQFVRYRLLKIPAVDAFISNAVDVETLCCTLHKLVLDGQWVAASDLPLSMNKLASLDPNGTIQIHLPGGPVSVEYGKLHRRLSSHISTQVFTTDVSSRNPAGQTATSKDRIGTQGLLPVMPAPGLTVQSTPPPVQPIAPSLTANGTEHHLRSLRQLVLDNTLTRNKVVIKFGEIPDKERYLSIFKDYMMNMESNSSEFVHSFNEHPPDAFLTCTLLCSLKMTYEPMGSELKCEWLPQNCHDSPIWTFCDAWSVMVAALARNEMFILHKALHLMLGLIQHGVALICFERILLNLVNELESSLIALVSIGHFLTLCGPSEIPEFGAHWVIIITRKQFVQQIIQTPNEWPLYHQLLVDALASPHSKMPNISLTLLMLLHKAPEFLCGYYLSLCDAVPPRAMQLRNMLTSAVPRSIKLPNPIILDEHVDIPSLNFTNHIMTVLRAEGLKVATDMFVRDPNDALVPVVLKELRVTDQAAFDVVLANHYVLYLVSTLPGILKKIPTNSQRAQNSLLLLEKIMLSCISQARHMLLSCMTNHMRYPNVSTFAFIGFILRLFNKGDQALQEQITLSLLERLLISRPHPWGVLHLLFQLVKNPKYDFWNRIEAAPEVEKHIRRIVQSCLHSKGTPQGKPSSSSEQGN